MPRVLLIGWDGADWRILDPGLHPSEGESAAETLINVHDNLLVGAVFGNKTERD